jgi:hypothetical protein
MHIATIMTAHEGKDVRRLDPAGRWEGASDNEWRVLVNGRSVE